MKIYKINNDLKINIDAIYSLQHLSNSYEIAQFEKIKIETITEAVKNDELPEFEINGELYKPEIQEILAETKNDKIQEYYLALNNYYDEILCKPEEINEYYVFLITGAKISVDKNLYTALDKELEKYVENNN